MLLFQTEVDTISLATGASCPPVGASIPNGEAWRWVFAPMSERCFSPVAVRNPPRLSRAKDALEQCSCWGLSMHTSANASIAAFKAVEAIFPRARKTLGTHVAVGQLDGTIGIATLPDHHGHFDLHPYKSAPFLATFQTAGAIP